MKKAFVSFGPQKKLAFPAIEGGKVKVGELYLILENTILIYLNLDF